MFPVYHALQTGQDDMQIRGGADPYILEIRLNLKENFNGALFHHYAGIGQNIYRYK